MSPSTYTSVGVGTTSLAEALMYFSHWPLQPLTDAQATAFAGLIIAAFGLAHAARNARREAKATPSLPPPPTTPTKEDKPNDKPNDKPAEKPVA